MNQDQLLARGLDVESGVEWTGPAGSTPYRIHSCGSMRKLVYDTVSGSMCDSMEYVWLRV
jgi:hypothetical protein